MARTRQTCRRTRPTNITIYYKNFNIWLQRYKQTQKYNLNLEDYIRKLLVYYPKDPQILKLLTLQIHHETDFNKVPEEETEPIPEIRRLFTKIASRYKRDFLQYQHLNVGWDKFPVWKTCRAARFFKFSQTRSTEFDLSSVLKKTIKTNKHIKAIQFGKNLTCAEEIVSNLRYIRSLESVYIKNIPSIPMHIFQRGLFASSLTLQTITLRGKIEANLDPEQTTTTTSDIGQLTKVILKLPNLKRLNFDTDNSNQININKIPFNILKKKDISYNIRLVNSQDKFDLLPATEFGLESVKFLGINAMRSWQESEPDWTFFGEEQLQAQDAAQKVLFISLFNMNKIDLSQLILPCRNITTLSLSLSIRDFKKGLSFVGLKCLQNLQNLFLVIDNLREYPLNPWPRNLPKCCTANLFNNLRFCAERLKSVSIHLAGETLQKNYNKILAFFKVCSETLTHFTLMFTCHDVTSVNALKPFYKGILLLKKLESLKLIYERVGYQLYTKNCQFEELGQCQSLKELCISMRENFYHEVNIPHLENLEKLQLSVPRLGESTLQQLSSFTGLKNLEFKINQMQNEDWTKLLKTLSKLKELETVKLHCWSILTSENKEKALADSLAELKILKELHPCLACIAYMQGSICNDTVWFFGKSCSSWKREADSFFWRDNEGLPKQRVYKAYG